MLSRMLSRMLGGISCRMPSRMPSGMLNEMLDEILNEFVLIFEVMLLQLFLTNQKVAWHLMNFWHPTPILKCIRIAPAWRAKAIYRVYVRDMLESTYKNDIKL